MTMDSIAKIEEHKEEFLDTIISLQIMEYNHSFKFGKKSYLYITKNKAFWDQKEGGNMKIKGQGTTPESAYETFKEYIENVMELPTKTNVKEATKAIKDFTNFSHYGPLERLKSFPNEENILREFRYHKEPFKEAINSLVDRGSEFYHTVNKGLVAVIDGKLIWNFGGKAEEITGKDLGLNLYRKVENYIKKSAEKEPLASTKILDDMGKIILSYKMEKL